MKYADYLRELQNQNISPEIIELEIEKIACQNTINEMGWFGNYEICFMMESKIKQIDIKLKELNEK